MPSGLPAASPSGLVSLLPYVPRLVVEWLEEAPERLHRRIDGSLAFVDVSGFTDLTERLSRRGKVGAEEMNRILDDCFRQCLDAAYAFDAEVIKWGGDAVLLLFRGDGHELRACRAAFEMQQTIRRVGRIRTGSGSVALAMSIGVHSGVLDLFLVGDLHRELVVAGPAATTTVAMEAIADAGEIAVSRETAARLDPADLGEEKDGAILLRRGPAVDGRTTPTGSASEDELAGCIPVLVREHLIAGGAEPEHRLMSAAFVHFMGVDELLAERGPGELAAALSTTLSAVERIALEYGVAFFDTDIYSGGGKAMLMAGAPASTGADEERMLRAMRAVLDAGLPLPLRIGVTRGRIFVGDFGPEYRRTYTVTGDSVNLAARLMARAGPGELLAADDVLSRSRTVFEAIPLEPFRVKGKSEPVHAFAVGAQRARRERSAASPLIGRDDELNVLLQAFASAAESSAGGLVEIVAEPGMGKSRLIEELRVRAAPVHALSVECDEYETATPYHAFREILRSLLGLDVAHREDDGVLLRTAVEATAPHLVPLLPLLGIPLGIDLPDTDETRPLEGEFRRTRLEEVVRELLGVLLLEPTLMVFEDTHWMDEASAALLHSLLVGLDARPWLVIIARRDQPTGFSAAAEATAVIALQPLAADQAAELVHAALEDVALAPHEVAALTERAGGNPLFLAEFAAASRTGAVDALPDTVEAIMLAEIDRLPPADRGVLRCAAVVGVTFTEELVSASLDRPADADVWHRLAEYVDRQPNGAFRFRHALVRDAAYEGLPYRRRRELHHRVGLTIEQRAERAEDEAALLSLHFFHSADHERAWHYSRLAGDRAQAIYANVEAAEFYERALQAAGRAEAARVDVAAVAEALGDVRVRLGEFQEAGEAYRSSRRHVPPGGGTEEARLMLKHALIPWRLGRYPQALRWLTRGLRALEGDETTAAAGQRASLYAWKGVVRQKQGFPLEAIRWCRLAIDAAEASGAREALGQAYYMLDWAYAALGRFDEAVYSARALEIYEELGDVERQALILNNLGVLAHRRGRWNESVDLYRRAQQAWEAAGDSWSASFAVVNRAEVLLDQGRLAEAEPLLKESLRIARASKSGSRIADAAGYYGRLLAGLGRFDESSALLAEAREQHVLDGERGEVLETEARIAELLVLQGDAAEGLAAADATLDRARRFDGIFVLVPTLLRVRGRALMQLGRTAEAQEALSRSLDQARLDSADYDAGLALDSLAALRRLGGGPADELERERDEIFARLGVVAPPRPTI
ncbi:MAG TPA: tetratricopeptide repeat protein [Gaiellaceae bacterium]|nr:tetratricopeptide repeat protein [Gaiellaceae bacterium]